MSAIIIGILELCQAVKILRKKILLFLLFVIVVLLIKKCYNISPICRAKSDRSLMSKKIIRYSICFLSSFYYFTYFYLFYPPSLTFSLSPPLSPPLSLPLSLFSLLSLSSLSLSSNRVFNWQRLL